MRRVIAADLKRILTRVWPWVLMVIAFLIMFLMVLDGIETAPDKGFHFLSRVNKLGLISIIVGFTLLMGIYGDEFKAMTMIGIIGRGLDRDKYVLSKFLDMLIVGGFYYGLSGIVEYLIYLGESVVLTTTEVRYLWFGLIFQLFEIICYVTIAALFFFMSENVAIGIFAFLAFELIVPLVMGFAALIPTVAEYHLDSYYVSGLLDSAFSSFIIRDNLNGILISAVAALVYIGLPLLATILVFRKKELEF